MRQNYFDNLRNVGILFDSSEEAAKHINLTWNNISAWWEAKELQRARLDFCNKYALLDFQTPFFPEKKPLEAALCLTTMVFLEKHLILILFSNKYALLFF